jgi:hypothetical protein
MAVASGSSNRPTSAPHRPGRLASLAVAGHALRMKHAVLLLLGLALVAPRARADEGENLALSSSSDGLISVDWKDAQLTDALRLIARVGNLNLVLDPAAQNKTLTLALHDVPWQQALDLVTSTAGFATELQGNVLRVAPVQKMAAEAQQQVDLREARALAAPLTTIAFPLSYADATKVEPIIRKSLSTRGSISVDRRTNTLIVTDVMGSPALDALRSMQTVQFAGMTIVPGTPEAATRPLRLGLIGSVSSPIVGIRVLPSAPSDARIEDVDVPVGRRVEVPGAAGVEIGIESDAGRLVFVARSGHVGAQAPAVGRQAFALDLASGGQAILVAEAVEQ